MTAIAHHPHRVARAVAQARQIVAEVRETPLWSMGPTETTCGTARDDSPGLQGIGALLALAAVALVVRAARRRSPSARTPGSDAR